MNTKKLATILIAVAFALIVLFSCMALFSLKEIKVDFAVAEDTDTSDVQETLNEFLGKNLMFLKTSEVINALKDYHYMEVLSVEKSYPNVLKVKIEERREIYYLEHAEKVYVTTSEGFVLNSLDKSEYVSNTERDKITLKITEIDLENDTEKDALLTGNAVGETIALSGDDFLTQVFEMAKTVQLTDCIKELKVEKAVLGTVVATRDVVITTYTGVTIRIMNADEQGLDKIKKAFIEYDNASTDYIKTFDYIHAFLSNEGEILTEWSPTDNAPQGRV